MCRFLADQQQATSARPGNEICQVDSRAQVSTRWPGSRIWEPLMPQAPARPEIWGFHKVNITPSGNGTRRSRKAMRVLRGLKQPQSSPLGSTTWRVSSSLLVVQLNSRRVQHQPTRSGQVVNSYACAYCWPSRVQKERHGATGFQAFCSSSVARDRASLQRQACHHSQSSDAQHLTPCRLHWVLDAPLTTLIVCYGLCDPVVSSRITSNASRVFSIHDHFIDDGWHTAKAIPRDLPTAPHETTTIDLRDWMQAPRSADPIPTKAPHHSPPRYHRLYAGCDSTLGLPPTSIDEGNEEARDGSSTRDHGCVYSASMG
ncbi:hypothetical protein B0T14DRAFT_84242 [Immersiella caudata]|uniref:Uncharacterized protein n=1 Tax=Immersiella caudata TaxID=314043 RepID=A0AA39XH96_9PEZI|nr:hypothetical protein B0T14DRAFT_84242 [Immersiella caudata]